MIKVTDCFHYSDIILECFKTDPELIEKWHIESGNTVENCAARTIKDLEDNNVSVYKLLDINELLIGYIGIEHINNSFYLTGFFIKPEFRTKEYIKEFWNIVKLMTSNETFYCGIYKKNIPALNFLQRAGGIQAWEIPNKEAVFIMMNWGV